MHHLASCAYVVQTFCPLTRQPPLSRTALVFSEARSDPDSGSENPWHQISSADRIGSRNRSFWSSLPWAITTGPPMTKPRTFAGSGTRWRASSSLKIDCSISVAPLPPYSSGQERPAHPASCIFFCQARRNSNSAWSSPSGEGPGWLSSSQLRTSSRKAASESVSVRSTFRTLSAWPTSQSVGDTHAVGAFRERIGVELPVVQAGMGGGLSASKLAATVSEAAGLGTIGFLGPGDLRREIAEARRLTEKPIAVNLLLPFARAAHYEAADQADVVVTFWGRPRRRTAQVWIHQCGSVEEALAAREAGANAVIAQGVEAGGHVRGELPAAKLLARTKAALGDDFP